MQADTDSLTVRIISFGSPEYMKEVELRLAVLREPLGLTFTEDQLEEEAEEIHINCFIGEKLAGTLLLKSVSVDEIKMRQVAVSPDIRGRGIGRYMVFYAEGWAKGRGYKLMSMHAREESIQFYIKLGYVIKGGVFTEVTIPHYRMEKTL